jgi:hypothetical protein
VDFFRELLAMPSADREKVLANRSAQSRAFLESKLNEMEALSSENREALLQTLQLRWVLLPLMKTPPDRRGPRLAALKDTDRRLVEERLQEWDRLPEDLQKKVLENENVIRLFFRSETNAPQPSLNLTLTNLTAAQREQMEKDWNRWAALPEEERAKILGQFERFFELSRKEKERIMGEMSPLEQRKMALALKQYARLPKALRESCLRGFQKFAALPPEEQQEFLNNAERWRKMSPEDRQIWRDLVNRLQPKPPLPPRPYRPPPLPPGLVPRTTRPAGAPSATGVVTN